MHTEQLESIIFKLSSTKLKWQSACKHIDKPRENVAKSKHYAFCNLVFFVFHSE